MFWFIRTLKKINTCSLLERSLFLFFFTINSKDLHKAREEKKREIKEKAEEELRYLKASGKVGKKPATKKGSVKKQSVGSGPSRAPDSTRKSVDGTAQKQPESRPGSSAQQRPGTASSMGRRVDEIFSVSIFSKKFHTFWAIAYSVS